MNKIGEIINFDKEIKLNAMEHEKELIVKEKDKGIVTGKGNILILNGDCEGKIILQNLEVKGYDTNNIADLILNLLTREYGIDNYLNDEDIDKDEVKDEISFLLKDILY